MKNHEEEFCTSHDCGRKKRRMVVQLPLTGAVSVVAPLIVVAEALAVFVEVVVGAIPPVVHCCSQPVAGFSMALEMQ